MTSIERYQLLLNEFAASINGLKLALAEDIVHLNPTLQDLVKNGRIQKLDKHLYTFEMLYNLIK